MGDDDDFDNFDPRKHWAWENNEEIRADYLNRYEMQTINKLIKFLEKERLVKEIVQHLGMKVSQFPSLLAKLRWLRKVSIIRRDDKHIISYQVKDFRQSSKIS